MMRMGDMFFRVALLLVVVGTVATTVMAEGSEKNSVKESGKESMKSAIFAGGCFWCMESTFEELTGVSAVISGYTGGQKQNPTYEEVSAGGTGHAEAIKVEYDPKVISYQQLLDVFWRNVDPLTKDAQFCDHGSQYRAAIFYGDPDEQKLAEESKAKLIAEKRFNQPIVTEIVPASAFFPAEDYHQGYYKKNPVRYKFYRYSCGRDKRLFELWGEPVK